MLIAKTEKASKAIKIIDDRPVKTSHKTFGYQYYFANSDGKLEYVRKRDIDKVQSIFQLDYYHALRKELETVRRRIGRFLKIYDIDAIKNAYENLSGPRKALVTPLVLPDEDFVKYWRENHPGGLNSFPEEGQYRTNRGELVRSKSEKILADTFDNMGIPYSYEPELRMRDGTILYPDFALLNVRTRKTFYWEHFGLISDGEYARNSLIKLNRYETNGLYAGTVVLFSMESVKYPLNTEQIETKIRDYLL